MSIIKASNVVELPMLFAQGSKKTEILQWRTWTIGLVVFFAFGKVDGKQIESKYTADHVNVGKANYRDCVAQAQFESKAAWQRKLKEGYFVTVEEAKTATVIRPMKAHRLDRQGKKLRYPCDAQRKYNGYRCLAICNDDHTFLMSNGGETWKVPHILEELKMTMSPGDMLDGELYIHGVSLQKIGSLVKDNRPESLALEFHIYDMPQLDGKIYPWEQRRKNLGTRSYGMASKAKALIGGSKLFIAETVTIRNEIELETYNKKVIAEGYEGVILRNLGGEYRFGYRSYDVFKHKNFQDSEFLVVDMTQRTYSLNGVDTVIVDCCICRNNLNDKTFEVVPKGDIATKAEFWTNREKYIGSRLMVRYLERSDDGIPQGNPVGVAFRLDEDTSQEEPDMFAQEDS